MGFSRQEFWGGFPCPLQGIFPTQGSNLCLPHCRWILYHLSHQGSPASYAVQQKRKKKKEGEREAGHTAFPPSWKQHRPITVIASVLSGESQRCSHWSSSFNSCSDLSTIYLQPHPGSHHRAEGGFVGKTVIRVPASTPIPLIHT